MRGEPGYPGPPRTWTFSLKPPAGSRTSTRSPRDSPRLLREAAVHRHDRIFEPHKKVAPGRIHQHQTVTVLVSETTLTVEFNDGDVRVIRRTTTQPVRSIKGQRPRTATSVS
jgi:hypothetical protein